jgi:arginine decarboxylase
MAGHDGKEPRYRDAIVIEHAGSRLWDYLRYDEAGDLWIQDLRVSDAVRCYGTPLEIVDTTLIERRCDEWRALCADVAADAGYPGRLRYLYASKANMASEVAHAAYRSGWSAETSSHQDLVHLRWLCRNGLLPAGLRVVCNGFKLPLALYSLPDPAAPRAGAEVALPDNHLSCSLRQPTYAEAIVDMARDGWDITPILDEGELPAFTAAGSPDMQVGLRMKLGRARTASDLAVLVSRFGTEREALLRQADEIAATGHLRLTTLHTMVGAAESIPVDEYVAALLLGMRMWLELRRRHPALREVNVGGGMPPLSEPYDHRAVVGAYLRGTLDACRQAGLPAPDVTFELGSLVAEECGFHVFGVLQRKRNHTPTDGEPGTWAIVDGGLMAAIPDMLLLGKSFRFLAVQGADEPAERVLLGDVTCDSDGRYPPKSFGPARHVLLPTGAGPRHVLIQGVGAYQEILAGVRGAHHCGLLEAMELILERRADGRVHGRLLPRQTSADAAHLLGYVEEAQQPLRLALQARGGAPTDGRAAPARGNPEG